MEANRDCMGLCILLLCLTIAATFIPCGGAGISIDLGREGSKPITIKNSQTKLKVVKHTFFEQIMGRLSLAQPLDSNQNTGLDSPFIMPPSNALNPNSLPESAPPGCPKPLNSPQTPSTTINPPPRDNSPPSSTFLPPTLPGSSPPLTPIITVPTTPFSSLSPPTLPDLNPPLAPSESFPSPDSPTSFSPPIIFPGAPEATPSPPGAISNPPYYESSPPIVVLPSPSDPILAPPGYILSPPYYESSPPFVVIPSPSDPILAPPGPVLNPPSNGLVPSPSTFLPPVVFPPPTVPSPPYVTAPSSALWCVAKPSVPEPIIQEAMNYACGTGADCMKIQPNGPCFAPDTLFSHASYAFNSYWQRTKTAGGTCEFGGTAILVTVDPSYDGCRFEYVL